MPDSEPVSLIAGIIAALLGLGVIVAVLVRLGLEVRQRRQLRAAGPDLTGFDPDVRRYLDRVWLLVASWKPRLDPEEASELTMLWDDAFERASALQAGRAPESETTVTVAELVELEKRIEARLAVAAG